MSSDDFQTMSSISSGGSSNSRRTASRSSIFGIPLRGQNKNNESQIEFKEQRRIVFMGGANVGKTSIIKKFLFDQFTPKHRRTVEDFYLADFNLSDGASLTLEILDTTGSYEFPAMRDLAISKAHAFVLVYSVGDMASWEHIRELREQVS